MAWSRAAAFRGRGHEWGFADLWAGNFVWRDAGLSVYGEVQVLANQYIDLSVLAGYL
jgi:hypothetical protein